MKKKTISSYLRTFRYVISLLAIINLLSCNEAIETMPKKIDETRDNEHIYKPKRIDQLGQEVILLYSKSNSCYLPLLKDSSLYYPGSDVGFQWLELFNDSLSEGSEYKNRYLVGDFMALNEEQESRGIEEKNPKMNELIDFKKYDEKLFKLFDAAEFSINDEELLYAYIRNKYSTDTSALLNFYEKVWRFKTPPYKRKFSRMKDKVYANGQRVCLCEAREDTLLLIAQYATSSKRLTPSILEDSAGNVISTSYVQYLPIGDRRTYYASQYRITSKNWESDRKYEEADLIHDKKVGGGNKRVTYYKGRAQLPNFLLMEPTKNYPKAMRSNGIHEVALRGLSRGMLGTANSVGCIRLSDFGSKFTRWWVPQAARFFVIYSNERYHREISLESIEGQLPFKSQEEGNLFREWLHANKPLKAKQLDIDMDGSHDNGFILDAYNLYGEEYKNQINDK
ncbi:MAG: hypothetical protein P8H43_03690 [Crocinitomicaceae bacterium]|jgi:hypothetical protein|nr:hypothetical protein [Crocinitomicaceae bacterium]